MKFLHLNFFLLLLGMFTSTSNQAQIVCNQMVNVTLGPVGTVDLQTVFFLEGNHSHLDSTWLDQYTYDCADLGINMVTVYGSDNGNVISCTSTMSLEDKLQPIAIADNGIIVTLDSNGEYQLSPSEVDEGSFDNCSPVTLTVTPSLITCGMENPATVVLTVTDLAGNTNQAWAHVYYQDNNSTNLACNDNYTVNLPANQSLEILPEHILATPYTGDCPDATWVDLTVNGVGRANNTVSSSDAGATIVAEVNAGGSMCWGHVVVTTENCDTSLMDSDVIWPQDIVINQPVCQQNLATYLTPSNMMNTLGIPASHAIVDFGPLDPCLIPASTYSDQILNGSNGYVKIIRDWVVVEWNNGTFLGHTQIIELTTDFPVFCDTLPWNTPVGDCASGHTLDDDIEWPADITINTVAHLPSQLANNPNVLTENVEPQVGINSCWTIQTTYEDIMVPNGSNNVVLRTWTVFSFASFTSAEYTQKITTPLGSTDIYCAYRNNGDPIPDVEMAPGYYTDDSGCVDLSAYTGDLVEPTKDSPAAEGVDIYDEIIAYEHILGITTLPFYTLYPADISNGGGIGVSTLDVVLMRRMQQGLHTPNPEDVWTFFDFADPNHKEHILKSENNPLNTFIGVKLGDLDDSYDLDNATGNNPPVNDFVSKDEVLNAGQSYFVPVYHSKNEKISGFNFSIETSDKLDITRVYAPALNNFSEENLMEEGNIQTISYIASDYLENGGLEYNKENALVILVVKAKENAILSEELSLTNQDKNRIYSEQNPEGARIELEWEDRISSSTVDIDELADLLVYPNPASNILNISTNEDYKPVSYMVSDLTGKMILLDTYAEKPIDISNLNPGFHIIQLVFQDGSISNTKFLKVVE